jgi:hypothetical protein
MAKLDYGNDYNTEFYSLNKHEVVELITLLTAQLAGVCPVGRQSGACASIKVNDKGRDVKRMVFAYVKDVD